MFVGIHALPTDLSMPPGPLAAECEGRGYESLWVGEHTNIPVSRRSPFPAGGALPDHYRRLLDPFLALGTAAAVTERLRLGTGVCLVAQHDPIALAKRVATLDHLSGGRFLFGVGFGWNKEEVAAHGIDPGRRREAVKERILAMQRLWSEEEATFSGEFVSFEPTWMWPKPLTKPWPPILFGGGSGGRLFETIADVGDGWMPIGGSGVAGAVDDLRRRFEVAGRDPASVRVTVSGVRPTPEKLDHYAHLGVDRVLLSVPSAPADAVRRCLDRYGAVITEAGLAGR